MYGTAQVISYVEVETLQLVSMCPNKLFITNLAKGKSAKAQYNQHFQQVSDFMAEHVIRQELFREVD